MERPGGGRGGGGRRGWTGGVMLAGMEGRDGMRAADTDREATAERLRVALEEGRLDLHEYDERLQQAYGAKTYARAGHGAGGSAGTGVRAAVRPRAGRHRHGPVAAGTGRPGRRDGARTGADAGAAGDRVPWRAGGRGADRCRLRSLAGRGVGALAAGGGGPHRDLGDLLGRQPGPAVTTGRCGPLGPWGALLLFRSASGFASGAPRRDVDRRDRRRAARAVRRGERREQRRRDR